MTSSEQNKEKEEEETRELAFSLANAVVFPMVLKSAMELNIIEIISTAKSGGTYLSPSEIAKRIPTKNPDAPMLLERMLRLLASYDVLKCLLCTKENGEIERLYGPGRLCKFFIKNENGEAENRGSLAPLFLLGHDEVYMKSWYHLNDAILEGGIPFVRAYGMTTFEYPETDQRFNRLFNQAMSNYTTLIMNKILPVYKGLDGLNVLVDVGGGIGATLSMIISKYPYIKGINFDLPHIIADAPSYAGMEHVGGDMFENVPKGDAIFMKWVLHDWSDEHCLKLLKNCWEALPSNGKVIIVESILPMAPENKISTHFVFKLDLTMLANTHGGKERTQKEFEALALKSGFSSCEVISCADSLSVLEFHKGE